MKHILKYRWIIFSIWIIATLVLTVFQPDVNAILRQRGQNPISKDSPSSVADSLLEKMETTKGTNNILVFYDKNKISDEQMKEIESAINSIKDHQSDLGINELIDPFNIPEAKDSLLSKDGTTLMVSFKLDKGDKEVDEIQTSIDNYLTKVSTEHYLTGQEFINNDYLKASVAGVEKSAVLTVIFILIILIIMFRSVIIPFVSLIAVAFSYLTSMGIAAQLIDKVNFPVTTLTQLLLVLILFGIGTDYNILLFNRFKEELYNGLSVDDAIIKTYKTAGKTIAFSVLTILIAFLSLIFSESPIYKSAVVVVIGATMLLIEILTLTPFAMKLLGAKLFWPSKSTTAHKESRTWDSISKISTKHPIVSGLIIALIIGASVLFHQQKLNFDTISELGNSYTSTKGFSIVSDHFGKGQAMPVTVVIESDKPLDNNDALSAIDTITETIKNMKGVSKVSSASQPEGKQIENFYIGKNMNTVTDGLSQTEDGVTQIYDGLKLAQDQLTSADFSKVSELTDGTKDLKNGMDALTDGLQKIKNGINDGSTKSESITNGITAIKNNLKTMNSGLSALSDAYTKMQAGYEQMGTNYQGAVQALLSVKDALSQMQMLLGALGQAHADLQNDPYYQGLTQAISGLSEGLTQITPEGIQALNAGYNQANDGFKTANKNLAKINGGLSQIVAGLDKLESGLGQASDGMTTIIKNMNKVTSGLDQMADGQEQLATGLAGFGEFGTKLSDVNDGLKQISDGLDQTNQFLTQLNNNKTFYIPKEALNDENFKKALDMYMSKDRTVTKLTVVLNDDPYAKKSLDTVSAINKTISGALKGTSLHNAKFGVSGPSATTNDTNNVLSKDLNRMILIVLIGVFLILLFVIRSFWTPVFITIALVGSYFIAIFVTNGIFINFLGYAGLSSFVPFFAFIAIVSLGVDYSIFLMMRYKEYPDMSPKDAIITSCRHIGGVVTAAAIILGGTFATLIPSGLVLLIELAIAVITGLLVLCFIMLPVFLPAMIAITEKKDK